MFGQGFYFTGILFYWVNMKSDLNANVKSVIKEWLAFAIPLKAMVNYFVPVVRS